jgi:hypothetical protein
MKLLMQQNNCSKVKAAFTPIHTPYTPPPHRPTPTTKKKKLQNSQNYGHNAHNHTPFIATNEFESRLVHQPPNFDPEAFVMLSGK